MSLTSTLFVDEGDTPPGRASIVRDVTDLRRMQEEIHRSQHLASIGEMGATIAHEIKNPLAGISGVIQVLRDELEPEDPRREVLGEVLSQVRRLDNTVHELLMFAKPWVVEPADCDLRETVETVARRTLEHHVFADASIRVDGDPRVIARVDRDTVEQVLWNLLTNAAQAAPDGGEIRCTVRRLPDKALVTVADRGGGIPVEIREHVLNPFFTTKTQGTGLGLSVCRKIMDAHKGMMTIVSTPGHGTEVRLEFPVEEES